ncbi:unnamed protein product [Symbiodinium necroappetens]|uniref:Uncharacterized protein n=1 Tax=Symbiodinium necroappetens TaxID=1628268 RepID=A0A812IXW5_9DINO|nr:unnamed protein product [Symbiodinium necroappetens]
MGKNVISKFNKNDRVKDLITKKRASERVLDDVVLLTDNIPVERQEALLQDGFDFLDEAQLKQIADALDPKIKFQCTEERLASIAGILFKEVGEMEVALSHIQDTKNQLILLFIQTFAQGFSNESSNPANFDLEPMRKQVDYLGKLRIELRRRSSDNSANEAPAENRTGCCIM